MLGVKFWLKNRFYLQSICLLSFFTFVKTGEYKTEPSSFVHGQWTSASERVPSLPYQNTEKLRRSPAPDKDFEFSSALIGQQLFPYSTLIGWQLRRRCQIRRHL
jgi:hypothetical protein